MHVEALAVLYYTMYVHEELEYTHSIIHAWTSVVTSIIKFCVSGKGLLHTYVVLTANVEN